MQPSYSVNQTCLHATLSDTRLGALASLLSLAPALSNFAGFGYSANGLHTC